jgi:hypothetical protein
MKPKFGRSVLNISLAKEKVAQIHFVIGGKKNFNYGNEYGRKYLIFKTVFVKHPIFTKIFKDYSMTSQLSYLGT